MKIILSRKGFDLVNGGYLSPILDDKKLVSLPIPQKGESCLYSDLKYNNNTYLDLMKQITPIISYEKIPKTELTFDTTCHLDPDLCKDIKPRKPGWKGSFGPDSKWQTHLKENDVKEGDVFLFFGTFKNAVKQNGDYTFESGSPVVHLIFGYLQVGQRLCPKDDGIPAWMIGHPHAEDGSEGIIYVAKEKLSWNKKLSGSGVFDYHTDLVLTKKGYSKSRWDLPTFFREAKISCHKKNPWKEEGYFQSVGRGQEFVVYCSPQIKEWTRWLINTHASND